MKRSVLIRWPQGKLKALTLSYDDGRDHDRKMIEILDKAGIKCTFNLNNAQIGKTRRKTTFFLQFYTDSLNY